MAIGIRRSSERGNTGRRVRVYPAAARQLRAARAEARQKALRNRRERVSRAHAENAANQVASEADALEDWIHHPAEVLQRIHQPANETELRHAVLFAETLSFDASLREALLAGLAAFIDAQRFAAEESTIIVVGSAIRKYAMNMSEADFEAYLNWLRPAATQAIGPIVELELVKAFNWRLNCVIAATDAISTMGLPNLVDVCLSYLHQRIILQKNHVSTVIAALSAIAVFEALSLTHGETERLFRMANELQLRWFSELLADQLDETIASLQEHSPELAIRVAERTAWHLDPHRKRQHASV